MAIKNEKSYEDPHINDLRAAFEHRATWFYLVLDEARKKGLDWEDFARKAIHRCGCFHGDVKLPKTEDLQEFAEAFATDNVKKIFEMDVNVNENELVIEFNYCPLVEAWLKQTDNEEDIDQLCDLAMEGDRGIIDVFPKFDMDLQKTIAGGADRCRLVITKKD